MKGNITDETLKKLKLTTVSLNIILYSRHTYTFILGYIDR